MALVRVYFLFFFFIQTCCVLFSLFVPLSNYFHFFFVCVFFFSVYAENSKSLNLIFNVIFFLTYSRLVNISFSYIKKFKGSFIILYDFGFWQIITSISYSSSATVFFFFFNLCLLAFP